MGMQFVGAFRTNDTQGMGLARYALINDVRKVQFQAVSVYSQHAVGVRLTACVRVDVHFYARVYARVQAHVHTLLCTCTIHRLRALASCTPVSRQDSSANKRMQPSLNAPPPPPLTSTRCWAVPIGLRVEGHRACLKKKPIAIRPLSKIPNPVVEAERVHPLKGCIHALQEQWHAPHSCVHHAATHAATHVHVHAHTGRGEEQHCSRDEHVQYPQVLPVLQGFQDYER